ncbi:hypothetical protein N9444_07265 [Gammaproteobacteria bacterium]|nr:hypothetical protein [Gammaproteobacteria bacterium]
MEFETQDDPLQRFRADEDFDLIRELMGIGVPIGRSNYSGFDREHLTL